MFSLPHGSPNRAAVAPEIELRIEPDTLRFQCPNTGREVDSGINKPWNTRLISIRVRCPICENFHDWGVADATLGTVWPADRPSNDRWGPHNKSFIRSTIQPMSAGRD
jgi:predicted RNA-binding Zn-ribbon protein involved in translation (DUF1610 family)